MALATLRETTPALFIRQETLRVWLFTWVYNRRMKRVTLVGLVLLTLQLAHLLASSLAYWSIFSSQHWVDCATGPCANGEWLYYVFVLAIPQLFFCLLTFPFLILWALNAAGDRRYRRT